MKNQEAALILNEQRNKFMDEWVDFGGVNEAYNMAIALLKEREPKTPIVKENVYGMKFYYCPTCNKAFYQNTNFNFCDKCGQEVTWNA